ncbi:MAG: 4a-hydroxytetrahydrobiopterin dehydratase [Acidimicrobiales bacterium]
MPERPHTVAADELERRLGDLHGWSGSTDGIERTVEAASFPAAIELVRSVANVAEAANHHPDIDIRWRQVRFALTTHDAGGVTELDLEQAAQINRLAGD